MAARFLLLTAVAALAAGSASAQVTVTVGARAAECSSLAKRGQATPEAFAACTDAIYTEPLNNHDLYGTYVNRGTLYLVKGDSARALADFDTAKAGAPMMGESLINRGAALINLMRSAEAEPEITKGIEMGTEEPHKAYYNRGLARWWLEDFKGAYLDLRKAQELKPDWDAPRNVLVNFTVTPAPPQR